MSGAATFQTFRMTAKCSPSQHRRLGVVFGMCAEMYNALLESWKGGRRWWLKHHNPDTEKQPSVSYAELCRLLTGVRADHPEWAAVSVTVGRGVIRRFERATHSFYKRCWEGKKKPGFPRFTPRSRWRSVEIPDPTASMICAPGQRGNGSDRWWRLRVKGLPQLRFVDRQHRLATALGTGSEIVELRVVATPIRVEVHVVCRHPHAPDSDVEPAPAERPVGLDKGLKSRIATSDGEHIPPRVVDRTRIRRAQRRVARAEKRSRSRQKKVAHLARLWRHDKERAIQADFRLAHRFVTSYDAVMVEDLRVAAMLKTKMFSKKMSEQRWTALDAVLEYKAGKAGIWHEKVDPSNTTTDCSECGHRQPMPLSVRVFDCGSCELVLNRDHNAARNVCARGTYPQQGEGDKPWARAGHKPVATRGQQNFCRGDRTPTGGDAGRRRRTVYQQDISLNQTAVNPDI